MDRKIRPLGDRVLVTSRGVKEEMDCGLVVPKKYLRNSNVCTAQDGRTVIIRSHSGKQVGELEMIVETKNILAEIKDGCIIPLGQIIHARKCKDAKEVIERVHDRITQFVEVLSVGPLAEGRPGAFGYVSETALGIQAVEDGFDEWLIDEEDILFYASND